MRCPFCRSDATRVVDSRTIREHTTIRRRRHCDGCNRRFTTYERAEVNLPTVVKRDGSRQAFDLEKLRKGLETACHKRAVSVDAIEGLLGDVERHFAELAEREVHSTRIGDEVLRRLKALDEVAYVRFASVYREFSDVRQFLTLLEALHPGEGI
ncbi:MAG: transcriptional repressor NrdR [Myxococcales bacterium]|nr:transcriptional repressor NrdR [Myxococcales bacterium]MCB9524140.1 transcriptional repressor NrdR [Myxococcales bacterium]